MDIFEDFYKPVNVGNFGVAKVLDYIEHESNSDRNKTLSWRIS